MSDIANLWIEFTKLYKKMIVTNVRIGGKCVVCSENFTLNYNYLPLLKWDDDDISELLFDENELQYRKRKNYNLLTCFNLILNKLETVAKIIVVISRGDDQPYEFKFGGNACLDLAALHSSDQRINSIGLTINFIKYKNTMLDFKGIVDLLHASKYAYDNEAKKLIKDQFGDPHYIIMEYFKHIPIEKEIEFIESIRNRPDGDEEDSYNSYNSDSEDEDEENQTIFEIDYDTTLLNA